MCGLVGVWSSHNKVVQRGLLERMVGKLNHRGPDGSGIWLSSKSGIGLGHARLSILDVSFAGSQPMSSSTGRYVMVYNGETYNHLDLRRALPDQQYRGSSDTETLLALFEYQGVETTVKQMNGMFAFGVWDSKERVLVLGRDRLGIKPLYFGVVGSSFVFGSDLAVFKVLGDLEVSRTVMAEYLRYACVPHALSIYEGIQKLEPGCLLQLRSPQLPPTISRYWDLNETESRTTGRSWDEHVDMAQDLLRSAVAVRMLSDRPLGIFLSGGIDSSTVAALAQDVSDSPVHTFSLGFEHAEYDERTFAAQVAGHLGTNHFEFVASAEEALEAVSVLGTVYSEPFADSSQLPTFLLARHTRAHVTVALSGDGGDEVFSGYNRHLLGAKLWSVLRRTPHRFRSLLGTLAQRWLRGGGRAPAVFQRWMSLPEEKLVKLASVLASPSPEGMYHSLTQCWDPRQVLPDLESLEMKLTDCPVDRSVGEMFRRWDAQGYLQHDILTKLDRATMAVGLEARVPLLDHRVVEFGFRTPHALHVSNGSKSILRAVLARYVPRHLFERPKAGFAVPLGQWLRGPLREWAEAMLSGPGVDALGLDKLAVVNSWRALLREQSSHHQIWTVLMLLAWYENN